jgi:outer membrane protein assembly factor BamB
MMAPMRKLVLAVAALVLVAAATAFVLYRRHLGRDVRGSATVEFVPTAVPKPPTNSRIRSIVWPMFGYDVERSHTAPATTLRPPFRIAWEAGGRSLLEFPPAIAFGRLYLASGDGKLIAFSTHTGKRAWTYDSGRCVAAAPAVGGYEYGTVYETFLGPRPCGKKRPDDGEVVAVAAGTGKVRWTRRIGASETSPLLFGRLVIVGDWLGTVHCLWAETGKTLWTFKTGGAVKGAIAESGGRVFVGSYDGHVYALDAITGKLIWRASGDPRLFRGHGTFYSTPAASYGRVYIGSTDHKVYSFGAMSGKRRWSFSTGGYVYGSPAVWQQRVFVGSYDHYFYALDAATGSLLWKFKTDGPISGSATVVNGIVYFATFDHHTYALDARTGRLLWTFPHGRYTPVVTDGKRLYLLGFSILYGLEPR